MPKCIPLVLVGAMVVLISTGCGSLKPPETAYAESTPALMTHLDHHGVFYMAEGPMTAPQFSVPAQVFTVSGGGTLEVFEYKSSAGSLLDLSWMDDRMNGLSAPHLYRSDRMIAVYHGNDPAVQRALSEVFGVAIE